MVSLGKIGVLISFLNIVLLNIVTEPERIAGLGNCRAGKKKPRAMEKAV